MLREKNSGRDSHRLKRSWETREIYKSTHKSRHMGENCASHSKQGATKAKKAKLGNIPCINHRWTLTLSTPAGKIFQKTGDTEAIGNSEQNFPNLVLKSVKRIKNEQVPNDGMRSRPRSFQTFGEGKRGDGLLSVGQISRAGRSRPKLWVHKNGKKKKKSANGPHSDYESVFGPITQIRQRPNKKVPSGKVASGQSATCIDEGRPILTVGPEKQDKNKPIRGTFPLVPVRRTQSGCHVFYLWFGMFWNSGIFKPPRY